MCAFRPHCPITTGGFQFRTAKTPPPRPLAPCPRLPALSYAVRVINTTKNHTRRRAVPTVRKPCRQSRRRAHPFAVRKPCRRVRKICRARSSDGDRAQPPRVRSADGDRRRGNRADRFGNGHGFGAIRATMPPNAPQPPAVAFPPFGRVRARPDLPPRPVPFLCAVAIVCRRRQGDGFGRRQVRGVPICRRGDRRNRPRARSAANGSGTVTGSDGETGRRVRTGDSRARSSDGHGFATMPPTVTP